MHKNQFSSIVSRLVVLSGFCFCLETYRVLHTMRIRYIFLNWNLLLAWIPVLLAVLLYRESRRAKAIGYFFLWLVFFPNAPYIITDLLHLAPQDGFPFWFDAILIFSYAFTGLLMGLLSALLVFNRVKTITGGAAAWLLMLLIMMVSGYGIYMGRFLRYNSWDIFTSPLQVLADSAHLLMHPFTNPGTCGVTLLCGALLFIVFSVFEPLLQPFE